MSTPQKKKKSFSMEALRLLDDMVLAIASNSTDIVVENNMQPLVCSRFTWFSGTYSANICLCIRPSWDSASTRRTQSRYLVQDSCNADITTSRCGIEWVRGSCRVPIGWGCRRKRSWFFGSNRSWICWDPTGSLRTSPMFYYTEWSRGWPITRIKEVLHENLWC